MDQHSTGVLGESGDILWISFHNLMGNLEIEISHVFGGTSDCSSWVMSKEEFIGTSVVMDIGRLLFSSKFYLFVSCNFLSFVRVIIR